MQNFAGNLRTSVAALTRVATSGLPLRGRQDSLSDASCVGSSVAAQGFPQWKRVLISNKPYLINEIQGNSGYRS